MAGYHFNSALFRAAAVNHRVLQLVAGGNDKIKKLCTLADGLHQQKTGSSWTNRHIHKAHEEVDVMKHNPGGSAQARITKYADLVEGIGELLTLIEVWAL